MKNRHPDLRIAIVEKEDALAKHQTCHNKWSIHAGIYYKPGSMKVSCKNQFIHLCVGGLQLSYDYQCKNDIPHEKVGNCIAHDQQQVTRLNNLYEKGLKNKCPDIEHVNKECISN